ncbi:MAG: hypothetical protein SFZ24_01445 [Planctomycetota bacterium]|nr:hypothetical protein [Planctomycetota bacterium]
MVAPASAGYLIDDFRTRFGAQDVYTAEPGPNSTLSAFDDHPTGAVGDRFMQVRVLTGNAGDRAVIGHAGEAVRFSVVGGGSFVIQYTLGEATNLLLLGDRLALDVTALESPVSLNFSVRDSMNRSRTGQVVVSTTGAPRLLFTDLPGTADLTMITSILLGGSTTSSFEGIGFDNFRIIPAPGVAMLAVAAALATGRRRRRAS